MSLHHNQQTVSTPHHPARGFCQNFGLHPITALMTFALDQMLFVGELAGGLGVLLALPVSIALGCLAYHTQIRFFGDDESAAKVKAGAVALLTCIPTSLPLLLYVPAGFLGFFRRKR